MREPPHLRWWGALQWHGGPDPASVETCCCAQAYSLCGQRPVYEADCEPASRCYPALCRERCVQSSLPCVGRVDGRVNASGPRPGTQRYFPETLFAKEDKRWFDCGGNHLGCPDGAPVGLQCGLSGSRVSRRATPWRSTEGETAFIGDERCAVGKSNPYLSRKIYFCQLPLL